MTTLDKINGEAFSMRGLRFWGYRCPERPNRFSLVAQNEKGAIELWSEKYPQFPGLIEIVGDTYGGVETHSPVRLYDWTDSDKPNIEHCDVLNGPCWCDGSSLAYSETFLPLIKVGDSQRILELLAE